jgi:hypothetical protein
MGWPVPPLCRKDDPGSLDRIISELGQKTPPKWKQIPDLRSQKTSFHNPRSKIQKRIIHYSVQRVLKDEN